MRNLTIVDLDHASELSSSSMAQVTGGSMTCGQALIANQVYTTLAGFFIRGGDSSDGAAYAGKAQGVLEGSCPA
jgi:hypothetical protein